MKNYQFIATDNHPWSHFKRISENKARKLNEMGLVVHFADSAGNNLFPVSRKPEMWEKEKEIYREIWLNRMRPRKNKITYWIPINWYDRFNGEEVETFDTVRGLEEYNRDFVF